jgi:hypothetical protein
MREKCLQSTDKSLENTVLQKCRQTSTEAIDLPLLRSSQRNSIISHLLNELNLHKTTFFVCFINLMSHKVFVWWLIRFLIAINRLYWSISPRARRFLFVTEGRESQSILTTREKQLKFSHEKNPLGVHPRTLPEKQATQRNRVES